MEVLVFPLQMLAVGLDNLEHLLDPSSDVFFLKIAIVPRESFIEDKFSDLQDLVGSRIVGVSSLFDFFTDTSTIFEAGQSGTPPTFEINLPAKYGGVSASIIDFSFYTQYRSYIHNFILMVAYFFFARKMIKKLPGYIHI